MDTQLRIAAVVCAVALGQAAQVQAEGRPRYGGTLVAGLLGEPVQLDPVMATTHAELAVVTAVCDPLYRYANGGAVVPHLASGLPVMSEDGLTAQIPLRPGVLFHNGSEVTASDVARSLERARRSRTAGWLLAAVESFAVVDGQVVARLRRPAPELARLLTTPATSVLPGGRAPRVDTLIGTGAFRLDALQRRGRRLVLSAWEHHFAGQPYVFEIELRWYETSDAEARAYEMGESHISYRGDVAFAGHRPMYATSEVTGPVTLLVYIGFGQAHRGVTDNAQFRSALSLALDRGSFRHIGTGEPVLPAIAPAPLALGGPATRGVDREPQRGAALRELRQANGSSSAVRTFIDGRGRLEVIVDKTRPDDEAIAEKVVAALYSIGVEARITPLSARAFARRVRTGACDLYVGQLAAPTGDAVIAVSAAHAAGDDARAAIHVKSWPSLKAVLAIFRKRLPVVPLFHRAVRAHYRSTLGGVAFDSLGRLSLADLFVVD